MACELVTAARLTEGSIMGVADFVISTFNGSSVVFVGLNVLMRYLCFICHWRQSLNY